MSTDSLKEIFWMLVFTHSRLLIEIKLCLLLAFPLISAQLMQAGIGFIDTVMMGKLGSQALAAGGLGATLFLTLLLIGTGVVSSVSPLIAEAYGAGQRQYIRVVITQGLWLSVVVSIPIMVLLETSSTWLNLMEQPQELVLLTRTYLEALTWGIIPALGFSVLKNAAIALNNPRSVLVTMFSGLVFNAVANDILMHGKFGLPALGLSGIGWASTIGFWLMFLGLSFYLKIHWQLHSSHCFRNIWYFNAQVMRELLYLGSAIGLFAVAEDGLFTLVTVLMGHFGVTALASHQIVLQTITITVMIPLGISQAITVRVGQLKGALAFSQIRLAGIAGLSIGGAFMVAMMFLFWAMPKLIVSCYLDVQNPVNQSVVYSAVSFLRIAAVFQLFDGVQTIAAGALRGLQDAVVPMWIGILSYWGIGLFSGYIIATRLAWQGKGLWCGLALGLTFAAAILVWRFFWKVDQLMRAASSKTELV